MSTNLVYKDSIEINDNKLETILQNVNNKSNNKSSGLSLINPDTIIDKGINVDSNYRLESENNFDSKNIKWKFFGSPREIAVYSDGSIDVLYGLDHSFGYIVSISDSNLVYDICYGLIIQRVYSDYDYEDQFISDDSFNE